MCKALHRVRGNRRGVVLGNHLARFGACSPKMLICQSVYARHLACPVRPALAPHFSLGMIGGGRIDHDGVDLARDRKGRPANGAKEQARGEDQTSQTGERAAEDYEKKASKIVLTRSNT